MSTSDELTNSVKDLARQARELNAELNRQTRTLWAVIAVGGLILLTAVLFAYHVSLNNAEQIKDNNQKWCPIVTLLIPQPGEPEATTPRGLIIQERAERLAADSNFNCEVAP